MRLKLCFLFVLMCSLMSTAQIKILVDADGITSNFSNANDKSKVSIDDIDLKLKSRVKGCSTNKTDLVKLNNGATIHYEIFCNEKVLFWLNTKTSRKIPLYLCGESFQDKPCGQKEAKIKDNRKYTEIYQIPFPTFDIRGTDDNFPRERKNRYLIIDAHPNPIFKRNNSLYKLDLENDENIENVFKNAKSIPTNGSLAVFIKHYNFSNLKNLSVTINGEDYSYEKDINYLLEQLKPTSQDTTGAAEDKKDKGAATSSNGGMKQSLNVNDTIQSYLDSVSIYLSKIHYMNINDLYVLAAYQSLLKDTYEQSKMSLNNDNLIRLSKVTSYQPIYYSLTPIAVTAPDADEIDIRVSIQKENESQMKEHKVGQYRTSGGVSYDVGGMIYFTKLKSQEIFADSVMVAGKNVLVAQINEEDPWAIGIGLNGEMGFRTGTILVPTLNMGVFVPLDDETNTSFTVGGGLSLPTKKVKFSFSAGFAFGKIAVIKERFRNNYDLSQVQNLANEMLSEKVIKGKFYWGIGARFNLKSK